MCLFSLTEGLTDVTDVCMDENAVSSDPVIAFLLDEVVVKDWCKRTFKNIRTELQGFCILTHSKHVYIVYCLLFIWVNYGDIRRGF
ncbi:hypothetical protein CsSME_00050102 [Camellia sinensis var. sinensis]